MEFAVGLLEEEFNLESIIIQSIDSSINENTEIGPGCAPPSSKDQELGYEFYMRLAADSNAVASKAQVHSSKHNATCFKYRQKGQGKDACRFGMPWELVPDSYVDGFGVIHLFRNHAWINPWNSESCPLK